MLARSDGCLGLMTWCDIDYVDGPLSVKGAPVSTDEQLQRSVVVLAPLLSI